MLAMSRAGERLRALSKFAAKGFLFMGSSLALAILVFHFLFQPFQVAGLSMSPSLSDKDYLLVDRVFFRGSGLHRGDLVVFHVGSDPRFLVKRVVGMPGESVASRGGTLTINGRPLSGKDGIVAKYPDFGPVQVPEGSYFCLGDNPAVSLDSRMFGPIKKDQIYGRPFFRYLPLARSGFLSEAGHGG